MTTIMLGCLRGLVGIAVWAICMAEPFPVLAMKDFWLISPQEAAMAPATEGAGKGEISVGGEVDLGPGIDVLKPVHGGSGPAPVEVDIKFTPKLSPVDLSTLKVSVVKFISIDITDRVRSYASASGIHVPSAQIPSGKHTVRVSIADKDGMRSFKDVTFEVL